MGGIVRMTISLTVIIIETTGNLSFGLPIMITVIVAKWVGDLFSEGIYDIHIALARVPFLHWEPPANASRLYASEVMKKPVVTLRTTETVRQILHVLINTTHNGFPVVDAETSFSHVRTFGRYRGMILRWQLLGKKVCVNVSCNLVILQYKKSNAVKHPLILQLAFAIVSSSDSLYSSIVVIRINLINDSIQFQ